MTHADLDSARDIKTEVQQIGWITHWVETCTGDLDLDNYAWVTAEAGGVTLTDEDIESVDVTCPMDCVDVKNSDYATVSRSNFGTRPNRPPC